MGITQGYILLAIAALLVIAIFAFYIGRDRKSRRITPLAGLAFALVVAGLIFGQDRVIGYSLLGAGVVLALADVLIRWRR
ncbi:MAG: hypothetical protein WD751_11795 [Anaerolineales bacterium]